MKLSSVTFILNHYICLSLKCNTSDIQLLYLLLLLALSLKILSPLFNFIPINIIVLRAKWQSVLEKVIFAAGIVDNL